MKGTGGATQRTLDTNDHPLTRGAMIDLANSLVWDGDNDGALALVVRLMDSMRGPRDRTVEDLDRQSDFYMLLGMRSTLSALVGHRKHERQRRADRRMFRTKPARRAATTTTAKRTA